MSHKLEKIVGACFDDHLVVKEMVESKLGHPVRAVVLPNGVQANGNGATPAEEEDEEEKEEEDSEEEVDGKEEEENDDVEDAVVVLLLMVVALVFC
eukprot:gene20924-27772_t